MRPAFLEALDPICERIGVTRLARVTGLDRAGVEVACAIRPQGHVLQVSNGKALALEPAFAAALSEAAELWASEQPPRGAEWGSEAELSTRHPRDEVWGADALGSAGVRLEGVPWSRDVRAAWVAGASLHRPGKVWVPAWAVHCPPPGTAFLGPAAISWSSNGLAAHPNPRAALLHALLEVCERDQLGRALPRGFTRAAVAERKLGPSALRPLVATRALVEQISGRGFHVALFDLAPRGRGQLGLAVAGALLFDEEQGPVPLAAGYACAGGWDRALTSALLEAAQSRLTDIHGAREDVAPADPEQVRTLRQWCDRAPGIAALPVPAKAASPAALLSRLASAGHRQAAAFTLSPPDLGLTVVKVIVPGLRLSELL